MAIDTWELQRGREWRLDGCSVREVGGTAGGEAFLLRAEGGCALVDAGFAFSAQATVTNVRAALGGAQAPAAADPADAPAASPAAAPPAAPAAPPAASDASAAPAPDWLLLTHSHYDHCSGAGALLRAFPGLQVAASKYAARVFRRPGAWATMRQLNAEEARTQGLTRFEDVPDRLEVDRVLEDGDGLQVGSLRVTALASPGHTRCCLSFWCEEPGLLVLSETSGVLGGPLPPELAALAPQDVRFLVIPAYLVSVRSSLDFIDRARALAPRAVLVPHYGVLEGDDARDYLAAAAWACRYLARLIVQLHGEGASDEQIVTRYKALFRNDFTALVQPERAFDLNASYLVPMAIREAAEAEAEAPTAEAPTAKAPTAAQEGAARCC